MHFTKALAIFSLALTTTALPTVEDLVARQGTANTGTAQSCEIKGTYQACCDSVQSVPKQTLLSSVPGLSGLLGIVLPILLPATIQAGLTCSPILSGSAVNCNSSPKCCFNGPTTQNNGASLISLLNNNNVVFCSDFFIPVNVPIA